ncbi:Extracellular calcium-sensing receptor [Channa argus]|uniref:Extracellular calcium-sensing receptor n=1 Tax=Channa argus TaxID=215402 RepID=A0A6G1PQU4_CHAAH|nr:Extracellular calcium-sensing receptor [Channa argus]
MGFRKAKTMAFAIDEINRNSKLLPNVTLGYSLYDNCLQLGVGFRAALSLVSGQEEQVVLDETCVGTPPVIGIVGDSSSTRCIAISSVLGLYKVPMVRAVIQILKHFGWTWAGLLISDDDYGLFAARSFQSDLSQSGGGCLAYLEILPWGENPAEVKRIVDMMKKSTARVVIVFVHESHMINLMEEVVRQNVTGLQWIASEAWTSAAVLQTPQLMPYLGGTLGIAIRRGEIPGLRDFLLQTRPDLQHNNSHENSLVNQFWEDTFQCRFAPPPAGWVEAGGALCTGQEHLENVETEFLDISNLRPEYNVYKAVYALAYALDDMLHCEPGTGPFSEHSCGSLQRFELWQNHNSLCAMGFRQAQTMAFAIDEINRNTKLLPNVTLGYSLYDNCLQLGIGFRAALSLVSGQEEQVVLDETCVGTPPVIGIVGDSSSTRCIAISSVLGLYRVPMVRAVIQILKHFGWTWAGLLISDDDYGLHAARSFQSDLSQSGEGCLAYLEILPWGEDPDKLRKIVDVMKKSTARVVIAFAHESHMINIMEEVVRQNVTGLQWIASEAWTTATVLQTPQLMPYLGGTLGIAIRRGEIPGLRDFLLQIRPDLKHNSSYGNSLVNQFWEDTFQCRFAPSPADWVEAGGAICTGQEDLENVETEFLDISNLRPEYNVYKAVYALAYALDDMLHCEPGTGPFSGHSCGSLQKLEPWQLVYYLGKVNFTTPFGDQVLFDENGDVLPLYDVMNWLWLPGGGTEVQKVGEVKKFSFKDFTVTFFPALIDHFVICDDERTFVP